MSHCKLISKVHSNYRNRVRTCRLHAGIAKQEVLARRTGIPRTTLSLLENNRQFLSSPYALLIRDALACSLDDLYERMGPGYEGEPAPGR